ncbi:IclR family transcriptional regulator [Luethyella okanaganae]|uniref:IclR family transcriptional regulator n=1 Tax=Luethyella okanaganae TaxID=69372 RepID=A0ABW1VGZ8_9MICO
MSTDNETASGATPVADARDQNIGPRMPALRHGIAVLRFLAGKPGPVGAVAISRGLGLPRSSTYQILQVLTDEGLVVHIPDAQGYTLAVGVFELGSAYLRHQPLELLARPLLSRLMMSLNLTSHVGILYGHETLYLLKEQPARATGLVTEIGVRLPAHLTATGRAMLAMHSASQITAIYASRSVFVQRTERGPKTLRELKALLARDRERGWSVEDGHTTDGVTCIAAAAVDHNGMPVASFSVSFPSHQLPEGEAHARVGEAAREAAAQLTRRIRGDPSALVPRRVNG